MDNGKGVEVLVQGKGVLRCVSSLETKDKQLQELLTSSLLAGIKTAVELSSVI